MRTVIACIVFSFYSVFSYSQKDTTLALLPPMGWNSWNTFETKIDENLIIGVVDAFIRDGLKEAGYNYIVLDDGWMAKERDAQGNLVPDPAKFPKGLKHVSDYIHSKGLKFGIYNCAGDKTCGGYPGSRGHEYQDALKYAEWGVDYLKYDWCNTEKINAEAAYTTMGRALLATGRKIVFSLCEWGDNQPWLWGAKVGHLWRISGDIYPCFDCEFSHGTWSSWGVMRIVNMRDGIRKYSGPGAWNDPDMMEVGNGMSLAEDRTHFALWCMLAAPLILGNDVRSASKETIAIVTNKNLIAINQDSLGIEGFRVMKTDSIDMWAKPLKNGDWAFCFVNLSSKTKKLQYTWNAPITDDVHKLTFDPRKQMFSVKDLYKNILLAHTNKPLIADIASHDVLVVRVSIKK